MIFGICPPLFLAAGLLTQNPVNGVGDGFDWTAPPGLAALAEKLAPDLASEFSEAQSWTGLPRQNEPFKVLWVANKAELAEALGKPVPEWFAAVAIPAERRLVIATQTAGSIGSLHRTIRHELMHLAMADLGPEAFERVPAWFHEGCAELFGGEVLLAKQGSNLAWSAAARNLPSLASFAQAFPEDSLAAAEGYALSHAFVERVVRIYGLIVVREVLAAVHAGASFEEAFVEATGVSTVTVEEELRQELAGLAGILGDWQLQIFLGIAVFIFFIFPILRASRRKRRKELELRWAQEDDGFLEEDA